MQAHLNQLGNNAEVELNQGLKTNHASCTGAYSLNSPHGIVRVRRS